MRDVPISRIMTTNPVTISPDAPVEAARQSLEAGQIHHLPVVRDDALIGIVSSADLLKLYLLDRDSPAGAAARVEHIMQRDPETLDGNASLRNAAERLSAAGFHALPVTAANRALIGIVTSADVLDYVLQQLPRGDGSLGDRGTSDLRQGSMPEDKLTSAVKAARAAVSGPGSAPASDSDRALATLDQQNRALKAVYQAAELYLRSGHGEYEHSVLAKRLAAVRQTDSTPL